MEDLPSSKSEGMRMLRIVSVTKGEWLYRPGRVFWDGIPDDLAESMSDGWKDRIDQVVLDFVLGTIDHHKAMDSLLELELELGQDMGQSEKHVAIKDEITNAEMTIATAQAREEIADEDAHNNDVREHLLRIFSPP